MGFRAAYVKKGCKDNRCCYCRREMLPSSEMQAENVDIRGRVRTVEHIRPRVDGGTNDVENLDKACARCNSLRGHLHIDIFTLFAQVILRKYPDAPNVYLRGALQQFITSLAEIAIRNKRESRRAISLALLKLDDDLKRNHLK